MSDYHKVYKFPNGFGASVVCNGMSYGSDKGLFEVAVLDAAGNITYSTSVTSDVCGFLDFKGVAEVLDQIAALAPEPEPSGVVL